MKWYFIGLRNLLNLKGRASKKEFWWFFLVNKIVLVIAFLIVFYFQVDIDDLVALVWLFFIGLSPILIGIRRFHDLGRSGWNILWGLIPMVGMIVLLLALAQNGEPRENEYGIDENIICKP